MPLDDPAWLDRMYNNRTLVPDHARYMARWASDSARVRASSLCHLDVPYGDGPGETLDIFPAGTDGAPVLVVIHGGYWRALDKSDHSFIAPAFTNEGACVVVPNYALCPGPADTRVTVTHIVRQIVAALAWTWRHIARHGGDPSNIVVAGHSVGGHMATMLLACRWPALAPDLPSKLVRDALSISGLYDLEPLRRATFLTDAVGLTPSDVALASPVHWPAPHAGRLHCVAGGAESEEFLRQNRLMRDAWGAATVPVCEALPGLNHFSIVDALAQPGSRLHAIAQSLLFGPAPAALT